MTVPKAPDKAPAKAPLVLVMNRPDTDDLKRVGGSGRDLFNSDLIDAACRSRWEPPGISDEERGRRCEATVLGMMAFRATDEIEGMLVAQAMAMHHAAMECSRRAMVPDQSAEIATAFRKSAANASRTFCELLSALDRKRGRGAQQSVRVEHVHVHPGGQAIVGNVEPAAVSGGGGGGHETQGKPRVSPPGLAHDATVGTGISPLRRQDEERATVPRCGNGERPMQVPRREKHRPANR